MSSSLRAVQVLLVSIASSMATAASAAPEAGEGGSADEASGVLQVRLEHVPGSAAKGVWAEGILEAPAIDVEGALRDVAGLPRFMPYVREARALREPGAKDETLVHALLDLPLIGQRDYVVALEVRSSIGADGRGRFRSVWSARPERLPLTPGVVRFERNEGSWTVVALEDPTRCRVRYHFVVDPGGAVPTFLLDAANEAGLRQTFASLEREAGRRATVRRSAAAARAKLATPPPGAALPSASVN